ncbi:hypothetical protein M2103_001759 [Ereboglobus sp. PH5-5]|uniref:DUF1266 domain-containing protein n=1 Tax=unclassified Ereboglobus TaxID=2626932 RepID=UPI002406D311|nr:MULTISPECIES: DUF1266 domain-containing protein [unclassified Ereboglobus]MDF9827848.1 hypothetical protein [Ereboglobus sp. PH5-10]MDF9833532.1 hypothetical protein [Ereboglobus sp. PH5-5]
MTPQEQQLDAYLKQLKAMGLTDEMIEAYKQQFAASMNAASQWNQNISQFTQNMQQFNELFGDGDGDDDETGGSEITLSDKTTLTPDEQRAVACGADLCMLNDQYLNDLPTGLGKKNCRQLLSQWWDIDGREEMLETIARLQKTGHRGQFKIIAQAYTILDAKEGKRYLREDLAGVMDEDVAVERLRNLRDGLEQFVEDGLISSEKKVPDMMVWDFARIINISRAGFDAGYLEREEALASIMDAAAKIRAAYGSWKEMSVAYQFARYVWTGDDTYELMKANMDVLLSDPKSPWVTIEW